MNMRKVSKENTENHISKHDNYQLRVLFRDWDVKIMSYVMIIVVMIAMIAATVAWFVYYKTATVKEMKFASASCDALKVEVRQGDNPITYVEVTKDNTDTISAYMDMPVFKNVESYNIAEEGQEEKFVSKMAPGVYGSITIRLTSLNKLINHYKIKPETILKCSESMQENEDIVENLAKGHILFFSDYVEIQKDAEGNLPENITIDGNPDSLANYTHNSKYVYYNQIEYGEFIEGELEWDDEQSEGVPKEITVYWYWPYEYTNLSNSIKTSIELPITPEDIPGIINENRLKYFDKSKMQEIIDNKGSYNETQLYDYADTRIGTYVENIKLHVEVIGCHAEETNQQE